MKRRRILSDSEEEEEEDMGRRSSLRKRERISYTTIDQSDEDREEEDEEDNEQLGPSTQLQHNNEGEQGKSEILEPELHVTCGVKKGSLNVEKLAKGEDCILCERRWLSPVAFEAYAGKGSSKKWKASIFYNDEPLQTLFDEGILTAKSYRGRRTSTTKPQKILSSDAESGSSYEELYSGGETEEDDVQDDWVPGKGEKKRQGAESGGGDVKTTEEEEDKIEEGEIEDEIVPAVSDEDKNNFCKEMQTDLITSACGKKAARVVLKRLEERTERQSNCPGPEQPEDSWIMPPDDDTPNEGESRHNISAIDNPCITVASQTDASWKLGVKSEGDESGERKDGQTEIQTKTPARPPPAPATSSKPEDTKSISDGTANIRTSPVPETSPSLTNDTIGNCEEREEHLETIVQPFGAENINDSSSKNECPEPMSHSPKPLREQADNPTHTDATSSNHEAVQMHTRHRITVFHSDPQASLSSDIEEVSSSRCSAGIDLETMDLDQLKKEKIKMQIKVLKLQEEYYTMKIQGFRK